jgi:hypothetical protein
MKNFINLVRNKVSDPLEQLLNYSEKKMIFKDKISLKNLFQFILMLTVLMVIFILY